MLPALAAALVFSQTPAGVLDNAPQRTRLAVMSLSAAGVPEEYAVGLTETLASRASSTGVFDTISPTQIRSLLAYEKRKELLGSCVQEACYVQIAKVVRADHLVAGSVAQVGDKLALNLVLIDTAEGRALKRTSRETTNASDLLDEARNAVIVLLQPVLKKRQGYLKVATNVQGASIMVDDERRAEGAGRVIALAAGPHVLRVRNDGFYTTTADVFIRPGRVRVEDVRLIPARETIEDYESKAKLMRYGAYGAAAAAVTAGVLGALFYGRATDDKNLVDSYTAALDAERDPAMHGAVLEAQDSFTTNQAVYLGMLGAAIVAGGTSLYLFIAGDEPGRYEEFGSL